MKIRKTCVRVGSVTVLSMRLLSTTDCILSRDLLCVRRVRLLRVGMREVVIRMRVGYWYELLIIMQLILCAYEMSFG